jgi:hypothetical protein
MSYIDTLRKRLEGTGALQLQRLFCVQRVKVNLKISSNFENFMSILFTLLLLYTQPCGE